MTEALETDRRQLDELTTDLLNRHSDVEHLRSRLDLGTVHSPDLWRRFAETGLLSALITEKHGGAGLRPQHLPGVLHAMGYHAVAEPFLETAVLGVTALEACSDHPGSAARLEALAEGELVVGIRMNDLDPYVAFGEEADLVLDIDTEGRVTAHRPEELEIEGLQAVDPLRPVARVTPRGAGEVIGASPRTAILVRTLAVAGAASQLAGAARRLVDLTVEYVSVRHQFGRPVGSFQAVKHKIADVAAGVDMAEAVAASALGELTQEDAAHRAAVAKAYAGQAADLANVEALQLHGGTGFTWEYHLHFWLKRAMSLSAAYGTTTFHRRALAQGLLTQMSKER